MDYESVKSYLYKLIHYGASYGVDRMRVLLDVIGHPQRAFPVIHVAGTNGKGSVCAMLEAIYRKNGYRTGLFTSPHLVRLEERVQVDRKMISREELVAYVEFLKEVGKDLAEKDSEMRPSMFEIMNAIGFLHFSKSKIDIGIIETGLGGRFDSTNIVEPEIAVITSISRDHTEILGESFGEIAFAKAGIIKRGKPIVIGPLLPEVEVIIRKIAEEQEAEVFSVEEVFGKDIENYPQTSLVGDYQRRNAGIALLVSRVLKEKFPVDEVKAKEALKEVDWAGRWQRLKIGSGELILDCAHNEGGAEVLARNLELLIKKEGKKPVMAVGALSVYRAKSIIKVASAYGKNIILVKPKNPKAIEVEVMRQLVPDDFKGKVKEGNVGRIFFEVQSGGLVVVTGSIYLVGEVLERLEMVGPAGVEPATKG